MTVPTKLTCRVVGVLLFAASFQTSSASATEPAARASQTTPFVTRSTEEVAKFSAGATRDKRGIAKGKASSNSRISGSSANLNGYSVAQRNHRFTYGYGDCSDGWRGKHFVLMLGV